MVNTGTCKIYDAIRKVKGLPPSLNCMLIYTLIFMPFFIVLKKNTLYWSVIYTHKSAQVMSVNHDELRKWTHLCDTPVSRHSLVAQWLRICAPNAGSLDLIPSQGTKFHTPQLKSMHATTNSVQPSKYINNFKKEKKDDAQQPWKSCFILLLITTLPLHSPNPPDFRPLRSATLGFELCIDRGTE